MNGSLRQLIRTFVYSGACISVAACGGGGGSANSSPPPSNEALYTIGGAVTGMTGSGLKLRNSTTDLAIAANGAFTFPGTVPTGTAYSITVGTQPTSPAEICTVANGSGIVNASNVTNVAITCAASSPTDPNSPSNPSDPSNPSNPGPSMTLHDSTPANGAVNVARTVIPELNFSADLNVLTATATSVLLKSSSGEHSITPSVTGSRLTLTPARKLLPATPYTIELRTALRGAAGEALASPVSVGFTSADGQWHDSSPIQEGVVLDAFGAYVAFDASGNALAAWTQFEAGTLFIWTNRRVAGATEWEGAERVRAIDDNSRTVGAGLDASGNAFIVWQTLDGNEAHLQAIRRPAGGQWGGVHPIDDDTIHSIFDAQLLVAANGDAFVIWNQIGGTADIRVNRFTPADEWTGPVPLEGIDAPASEPTLAVDAAGNAVAAWTQVSGTHARILSSRYPVGGDWSDAEPINADGPINPGDPDLMDATRATVAIDANGNALAIWRQADTERTNIWSNHSVGAVWGQAAPIEDTTDETDRPRLAMNAHGDAVAVWFQGENGDPKIWSNTYTVADGWGATPREAAVVFDELQETHLAIDASGNALLLLALRLEDHQHLEASRYVFGHAWGASEPLNDGGNSQEPVMVIDQDGNALAIWSEANVAGTDIRVSSFD